MLYMDHKPILVQYLLIHIPDPISVTAQLNTSDSIELLLPASEGTATATRPAVANVASHGKRT